MKDLRANGKDQKSSPIYVPMSEVEDARFDKFLKEYGFAKGAFVRRAIFNEMGREEALRARGCSDE